MLRSGPAAFLVLSLAATGSVQAQGTSDLLKEQYAAVCTDLFQGAVTGEREISNLVTDAVSQRIATETNGQGYAALIPEIGPPKALGISDVVHLSYGDVFVCQFGHDKGVSLWQIGYSPLSQMIEDFDMVFIRHEAKPPPKPVADERASKRRSRSTTRGGEAPAPTETQRRDQEPAAQPAASEVPDIVPETPTQSEACQMFPDLC
jgi:hypothetical protein